MGVVTVNIASAVLVLESVTVTFCLPACDLGTTKLHVRVPEALVVHDVESFALSN